MYARVKQDCRFKTITAFGGREYTKRGWLVVPAVNEAEARRHPMLDITESMEATPLEHEYLAAAAVLETVPEPVVDMPAEKAPETENKPTEAAPVVQAEAKERPDKRGKRRG